MALILTRLRWALTVNGWRRSVVTLVFSVIGALYLLGMAVSGAVGLLAAGSGLDAHPLGALTVLVAAVVVLAWLVVPPLVTGVDATLDPASFVLFPVRARTLMAGLLLSTFTTPVGVATLIVLGAAGAAWWRTPAALAFGLAGALVSAATGVALGYGVTGLMSSFTGRRRVREAISLVLLVPMMLGGVALAQFMQSVEEFFGVAPRIAEAAAWTPFGAGLASAWAAGRGEPGAAVLHLVVALAWLALALALWHTALRRAVEPAAGGAQAESRGSRDLRWLGRPATDARTAIAARAQLYWFKDPRYMAGLVMLPLMVVLLWFVTQSSDGAAREVYLALGPFAAWALAYSISADIAYDHTAFHLHVVSGVKGRDDRLGRVLGMAGWGVPFVVAACVLSVALADEWSALPAVLGLSLGLLGAVGGMASLLSARWVYPVPRPGDSPLKTPQGAAGRTMVIQFASFAVTAVLAVPMLVPLVAFMVTGSAVWAWATLVVGVVWGAVALLLGVRWGAAWYDRAQAETLQAVKAW